MRSKSESCYHIRTKAKIGNDVLGPKIASEAISQHLKLKKKIPGGAYPQTPLPSAYMLMHARTCDNRSAGPMQFCFRRCHSIFPPPDTFSSGANGLRIWPTPGLVALGRKLRPWGESSGLMRRGISVAVMSLTIKGGCEMDLLTQLHFHDSYSRRI